MTDLTNVQGISNPRLVSASTQMFTTPIKPLAPLKPLADMGRITIFRTDSAQSSSNKCKNYLLKIYSYIVVWLHFEQYSKHSLLIHFSK